MNESNAQNLSRAFELIEADQLDEARELLEPLLAEEVDNADAWWLYAHAVENRDRAQDALNNVLRIDPNYAGANELLQETKGQSVTPLPTLKDQGGEPVDLDSLMSDDDDFSFDADSDLDLDDDFEDFDMDTDNPYEGDEEDRERNPRQMLFRLLGILAFVLILLFVFVVINPFGEDDEDSSEATNAPLAVVNNSETEEPTIVDTEEPTITEDGTPDAQTQSAGQSDFDMLYDAMRNQLTLVDNNPTIRVTELGNTLLISVCSELGDSLRSDLDQAMRIYAQENEALSDDSVEAVGITFLNCDTEETLNEIAVPRTAVTNFTEGNSSFETYRSSWRTVN